MSSTVWIIERDHEPIECGMNRRVIAFASDANGTAAMKVKLNLFPTNDGHYYDAVLYKRVTHEGAL